MPPTARPTLRARITAAAILLLAAFVIPSGSHAAAQAPADTTTEPTDTFALPDLVVTATRVPLDRASLPTPVTVLTGEQLRSQGIATVAEALQRVPGAAVARTGGSGAQTSLFMRGGEADYVKVLIDGVPVNDPGGAFDFASLSTDQVERIEVVRGPVSVLYGSDAVSGVVHILTRRGAGPPRVTAELTGGTGEQRYDGDRYGTWDGEVGVSGAVGALSYSAGGGREYSGGVYPLNNQRRRTTGNVRLGWSAASGAELAVSSRLSDGRSHFPTDGAGNIVDENAYLDRRLWTTSLEGGLRLTDRIDARVQLALVTRDQTSVDEPDGPDDTAGTYASRLDFDGTRRIADARVNARALGGTVTAGVAWEAAGAATSYTSESEFGPFDASADYDRATTGYYLQLLSSPFDPLHLTLGGRLDDSETFGTFRTYRLGAALRVTDGTRLRGALGRAFREPTFAESFGSGFGDAGNPALQPERSRSGELGVEQDIGPATLAVTAFDQRFDDLIQYTFSPPVPGDPNYFNVGAARARGVELEARFARGDWSASASYTRLETEVLDPGLATDATFAEGEELLRRPANAGAITARWAPRGGSAAETAGPGGIALTINAVGDREDVDFGAAFPYPRVTLPGYVTVDLAGDRRLPLGAGPAASVLVRVRNLLDAEYDAVAGFPGAGRTVEVGVRLRAGG